MRHVPLEELIVSEIVKQLPALYLNRNSLSCSQQPATWPCHEPGDQSHALSSIYLRPLSILSSLLRLSLQSGVFPAGFDILTYTYFYSPHSLFMHVIITIIPSASRSLKSPLPCSFPNTIPVKGTLCFIKGLINHWYNIIFLAILNSFASVCVCEKYVMAVLCARKITAFRSKHFSAELICNKLFLSNPKSSFRPIKCIYKF